MAQGVTPVQALTSTTASDLNKHQKVVLLRDSSTVQDALKVLASHRILSAPVVVAGDGDSDSAVQYPQEKAIKDVLAFVDLADVIGSFFAELDMAAVSQMRMLQRMSVLEEAGTSFAAMKLRDLKVMGGDGAFLHQQEANVPLLHLIKEGLLKPKHRGVGSSERKPSVVHRVAIFSSDNKVVGLISQTDIIRHVLKLCEGSGGVMEQTIGQLGLGTRPVQTTAPETSAFEVLRVLDASRISGRAIVGPEGKILGNFSISEMRSFVTDHFGALALPVGEFLALEHGTEYAGYGIHNNPDKELIQASKGGVFARGHDVRRNVSVGGGEVGQELMLATEETTLQELMEVIVERSIHRVYVTTEQGHPVKVVTMTDILDLFVRLCEKEQGEQAGTMDTT